MRAILAAAHRTDLRADTRAQRTDTRVQRTDTRVQRADMLVGTSSVQTRAILLHARAFFCWHKRENTRNSA